MVTSEAKQRMLTNVWRESYLKVFNELEASRAQAERLANALAWLLSSIDCDHCRREAREALEDYRLAQ